jgi:hypothetical protein
VGHGRGPTLLQGQARLGAVQGPGSETSHRH